jgi:hypothetical protein
MTQPAPTKPTPYHDSVLDFRRLLVEAAADWHRTVDRHRTAAYAEHGTAADKDAYAGSLMAASYSYTLAAVLGHAGEAFGPDVAHELGCVADELLMNGDFGDFNADVMPAEPASPQVTP